MKSHKLKMMAVARNGPMGWFGVSDGSIVAESVSDAVGKSAS